MSTPNWLNNFFLLFHLVSSNLISYYICYTLSYNSNNNALRNGFFNTYIFQQVTSGNEIIKTNICNEKEKKIQCTVKTYLMVYGFSMFPRRTVEAKLI